MHLEIREIHAASKGAPLNDEWFIVENVSEKPFHTAGCTVGVARGSGRLRILGTIDPGFSIAPGERVRVVTGNPGKKAHGKPPEQDGVRNYHLFAMEPLIVGPGTVIAFILRQHEVMRGSFDPTAPSGVAPRK
jgi:hypothetical protein